MNHQEPGCKGGNEIDLAEVRDKAVVKTVMNFQVL
jgi:hypothetical protein